VRVLVCHPGADFSVADVHRGYVKGLRQLGCQVAEFNLNDGLAFYASIVIDGEKLPAQWVVERAGFDLHGRIWEWWPDLIVVISGFYVLPLTWQILQGRPHKTAVIFTESPYEDDRQLNLVENADPDVVVVNDPINIERFRQAHKTVEHLPHCYDPEIHYPGTGDRPTDFSFVGTGYPSRIRLFEQVDWSGIEAEFAGHWKGLDPQSPLRPLLRDAPNECIPNEDTADLYRSSKMSANLYRGKDPVEANAPALQAGWAVGPREIELAACKTPFLREPRGEGDELFPTHPTFGSPAEFSAHLRWWLTHDTARTTAAETAYAAIADRTFDNNARRLLELVDRT
jgi:hypothetical protein